jgi:peptidoglycan/xylan/chitin deacetylase (PgdA/CDA1 family)
MMEGQLLKKRLNPWPDGYRCCVTFSFDFDAETLWMSRNPDNYKRPVTLSLGAYGHKEGVPRIAKLFKKYDLRSTFFVPGWVVERHEDMIVELRDLGHEIAHHGYLHEWPDTLELEQEKEVLKKGIEIIKKATGQRPIGYRSPAAEFSPKTIELLVKNQFLYTSTMMDSDLPYRHKLGGKKTPLIELPMKWHLDDAVYFMFAMKPPQRTTLMEPFGVFEMWKLEFDCVYEEHLWINYCMHPQIIGQPHRMRLLENLIVHIRHHSDVWIPTMAEAALYWQKKF